MFIENHRYLIWFSREVDTHSYRDFLKNQIGGGSAEYKPAFSNLDIQKIRIGRDVHVRL